VNLFISLIFLVQTLTATILFDTNGDGLQEGVGPFVVVELSRDNQVVSASFTDQVSSVTFQVTNGHYEVEAFVPRTSPFFRWDCRGGKSVDMEQEFLIVECKRVFSLQLPFISG
jgi:hypothetical protein